MYETDNYRQLQYNTDVQILALFVLVSFSGYVCEIKLNTQLSSQLCYVYYRFTSGYYVYDISGLSRHRHGHS